MKDRARGPHDVRRLGAAAPSYSSLPDEGGAKGTDVLGGGSVF